jgi:E3 ubiquitin-protein ligase HUWE1
MRTTVEVVTNETFMLLARLVSESLENTRSFWESVDDRSKLLPLVDTTGKFDDVYGRLDAKDI